MPFPVHLIQCSVRNNTVVATIWSNELGMEAVGILFWKDRVLGGRRKRAYSVEELAHGFEEKLGKRHRGFLDINVKWKLNQTGPSDCSVYQQWYSATADFNRWVAVNLPVGVHGIFEHQLDHWQHITDNDPDIAALRRASDGE